MSARICGCDPEQDHICEEHRERPTAREHADFMQQLDQWKTNIAAVERDTVTPVEESLIDLQRHLDMTMRQVEEMARRVAPLVAQQQRIAAVLETFYRAPVTISSLQPILDLARELHPEWKP